MSERPNVVLAGLLATAFVLTAALGGAIANVGVGGVASLAATTVGALTACVFFLSELRRAPLGALVLVVLTLASLLGFVRTLWVYRRERRLLAALPLEPFTHGALGRLAGDAGVRLFVTPSRMPAAFCFGLLQPRVVFSSGLLKRLNFDEQIAVFWHEVEHARNREPLKCLLARLAASSFFWFPALGDLLGRFRLVQELAADGRAVARTSTTALAGALYKVVTSPSAATVSAGDFAGARIDRLCGEPGTLPPLVRMHNVAISAAAGAIVLATLAFPARTNLGEQPHLQTMLVSLSPHGLPGMAAGLLMNGTIATVAVASWRGSRRAR